MGIIEGRIVHFVLPHGEHRPAIIVNAWRNAAYVNGEVNLTVFPDWSNDGLAATEWRTSVPFSEEAKPNTWHWPER